MSEITRAAAHAKLDEVFDELERIPKYNKYPCRLKRVMLQVQEDDSITGCVLVERDSYYPFITWGISPYDHGLHSGHYDLDATTVKDDWSNRVSRGW